MFKRFQVMDLFHAGEEPDVAEWVDVEKNLPTFRSGLYKVKLSNDDVVNAYYFADMIMNLCRFDGIEPCRWWHRTTKEPLYDVVQWGVKS